MRLFIFVLITLLWIIPTYSFSADWRELETIVNYDTGKSDFILDIDNLVSDVVTTGTVSGANVLSGGVGFLKQDGTTDMDGNVLFSAHQTYDVGSQTYYVRDIYLGSELKLDDTTLDYGTDGANSLDITYYSNGAGKKMVWNGTSATPTLNMNTNPLVGGTATTDDLILRTTSGAGTTGADIIFQGGTNGATELGRWLNSGFLGIGVSPWQELTVNGDVTISDDNPNETFRVNTDNTAFEFHANAAGTNDPWGTFQLWSGTDTGTGFNVNPDVPLFYTTTNMINFPNKTLMGTSGTPDTILEIAGVITLRETTAPGTPSANKVYIYVDSADSDLKAKNDAGNVITIADFP